MLSTYDGWDKLLLSFAPHIPRRHADDLFLALHREAELFVELDVLRFVGLEVAGQILLAELFEIAIHQCRTDALSLRGGCNADRSQMDMRLVGIEMAPAGKPLHHPRRRRAERL